MKPFTQPCSLQSPGFFSEANLLELNVIEAKALLQQKQSKLTEQELQVRYLGSSWQVFMQSFSLIFSLQTCSSWYSRGLSPTAEMCWQSMAKHHLRDKIGVWHDFLGLNFYSRASQLIEAMLKKPNATVQGPTSWNGRIPSDYLKILKLGCQHVVSWLVCAYSQIDFAGKIIFLKEVFRRQSWLRIWKKAESYWRSTARGGHRGISLVAFGPWVCIPDALPIKTIKASHGGGFQGLFS